MLQKFFILKSQYNKKLCIYVRLKRGFNMSVDIWQIGEQIKASDYYNYAKNNVKQNFQAWFLTGRAYNEAQATKQLANICDAMSTSYDQIINDQNEYVIELNEDLTDFEELKESIDEKIEQLYSEIKILGKKEEDGTITEEEQKELNIKRGELSSYMSDADKQINEKQNNIKSKNIDSQISSFSSKEAIAKDYGETTVEKAEEHLSSLHLFDDIYRIALQSGNNLLDKVEKSTEINDRIKECNKSFKI